MHKKRPGSSLSSAHCGILRRYGLSDSTISAWGCFSVSEEDLRQHNFASGVHAPGIALPIQPPGRCTATTFLYKPDQPRKLKRKNGKVRVCKYEHAVWALNRVHVPRSVQRALFEEDTTGCRVVITEGPIKAEMAAQEGINCVALPGVWNWRQRFGDESVPIEDFDQDSLE